LGLYRLEGGLVESGPKVSVPPETLSEALTSPPHMLVALASPWALAFNWYL